MKHYLLIDESGNHNLAHYDPSFPIFVLCGVLISEAEYAKLCDKINQVKKSIWGERKIQFHSRDIRKCQNGFELLFDLETKKLFYDSINAIVSDIDYTVFAAAIDKKKYSLRYKYQYDVYGIALEFIIERVIFKLDDIAGVTELSTIVEKRGRAEDTSLLKYYNSLRDNGTNYVKPIRIKHYFKSFEFQCKRDENIGLEFTDLLAYPIARHAIDAKAVNFAFDVIRPKIYSKNGRAYGIKIFP